MQRTFPILADEAEENRLHIDNLTALNQRLTTKNQELQQTTVFQARCADILGFLLLLALIAIGYLLIKVANYV